MSEDDILNLEVRLTKYEAKGIASTRRWPAHSGQTRSGSPRESHLCQLGTLSRRAPKNTSKRIWTQMDGHLPTASGVTKVHTHLASPERSSRNEVRGRNARRSGSHEEGCSGPDESSRCGMACQIPGASNESALARGGNDIEARRGEAHWG